MQSGQLLLIVAALVAIAFVVTLIRLRMLRESYSIVFVGAILLFVVTATWGFGWMIWLTPVSYTHLTLPTKRIV